MKILTKVNLILMVSLLSACHENPIKTETSRNAAIFLINASANAEKRLNFSIQKDSFGFGYLECMDGKKSPEIRCEPLLKGMVAFAKENYYPAFKNLRLSDLTDKTAFEKVANAYALIAATNFPQFFPKR